MILRILISLSIIVLTQCNKTTPEKSKLPIDADSSITEIIDYIPELPFEIVYKPIAKLPDSLAGREIRGKKYVNVLLDSTCGIEQLNIL